MQVSFAAESCEAGTSQTIRPVDILDILSIIGRNVSRCSFNYFVFAENCCAPSDHHRASVQDCVQCRTEVQAFVAVDRT